AVESIQSGFLKYLFYCRQGVYPPQGYNHNLLLREFDLASLQRRRSYVDLKFLRNLIWGNIDCSEFLSMLPFSTPRINSRQISYCRTPSANKNLMQSSSLWKMCNIANSIGTEYDIYFHSVRTLGRALGLE